MIIYKSSPKLSIYNVKRSINIYLGSSPFLVFGSENFLKKMSSFLMTMETKHAGHSQSPSGQEATPRAMKRKIVIIGRKLFMVKLN